MTLQCNKHNSSVCTLLLLNISIITYEAAQLYQNDKDIEGFKGHCHKLLKQENLHTYNHENQESSHNRLQYIT